MADENYLKYGIKCKSTNSYLSNNSAFKFQLDNFHHTSLGYYGRSGFSIIRRTLRTFLTPGSTTTLSRSITVAPTVYAPQQKWDEWISECVVPAVALRLIMEDRRCGKREGRDVMRESSSYGMAMFDEDSDTELRR
jgi:hypothetical protein